MDKRVKALWVEDLRKNAHLQGARRLYNSYTGQYCAIGRLCYLAEQAGAVTRTSVSSWGGQFYMAPPEVLSWAGLLDSPVIVLPDGRYEFVSTANDAGYRFETLAEWIEEQL